MRALTHLTLLAAALALIACGGRKSGAVAGQADLLAEDDIVDTPATTGGLPQAPGMPGPAETVSPAQASSTRCLGFTPDGAAYLTIEERIPGETGPTRVVRTMVAFDGEVDLPVIELGTMSPEDAGDDAMFGDVLEARIEEKLDPVNAAITEKGLIACQEGVDLEMGAGGFRRKTREMIAWPGGEALKITFRDGSVYAGPAGGAAKKLADAPVSEDAQYKLSDVFFTTKTPGAVAIITDASSEQARRTVVYIPTR